MRLAAAALAALAIVVAGCGGDDPQDVLGETAEKLGEIRSGELLLRVEVRAEAGRTGFQVEGPFALPEDEGSLPVAETEVTLFRGEEEVSSSVISTGEEAFVRIDGTTYELPSEQLEELGGAGAPLAGEADLGELEIGDWFEEPELSEDEAEIGGDATDRLRARLDVVAALNDLLALADGITGGGAVVLEGKSAEQVRNAVDRASVDVFTGREDRLLRRLVIDARFEAALPEDLRAALGDVPATRFELELTIVDPNGEVRVEAPPDAEPLPES